MVIMSDMESFGWKLSSVLFLLFGIVMAVLYTNESNTEPNVVYMEPDAMVDTLTVYDTVYLPSKERRSNTVDQPSVEPNEILNQQTSVPADTEKIE